VPASQPLMSIPTAYPEIPPRETAGDSPIQPEGATNASPDEARLLAKLRLLNQVAQAAAGSLDLPHLLSVVLRELDWYFPLHACVIWLLADDQQEGSGIRGQGSGARGQELDQRSLATPPLTTLEPAAAAKRFPLQAGQSSSAPISSSPAPLSAILEIVRTSSPRSERFSRLGLAAGFRLDLDQTPFRPCLSAGEAVYADLGRSDERRTFLAEELARRGGTSFFAVPLRSGERAIGVLQSVSTRADGFINEQVQMLYLVADLLGPAVSNCQLFSRLKNAYQELSCTQTRLVQAEKMRALGEMAGGMAHDFNNSLCSVLGFLDLALTDPSLSERVRGFLGHAKLSTMDAAQTVRRVQNFARWQRNEMSMQLLDVNELVRQTLELTRPKWESQARARGASIKIDISGEAPTWLVGSAGELREVLTNLIFNAVDAMPQGGVLSLRSWNTAADVLLSVRDTGVGMSDSIRKRLFEPFFTTKGERGTGLGLSVAFGIIQRYGGEITVSSIPGQGSEFVVRLPLTRSDLGHALEDNDAGALKGRLPPAAPTGVALPAPPQAKARSLRILVIEDQEPIRRFLETGLKQQGHNPCLAADAKEGLAHFEKETFDLVLTDLGLPGESGKDVAIHVQAKAPHVPVILLTGWSEQLQEQRQILPGVSLILGKPVTLQALAGAIQSACAANG
jgi:signal transduction histidine kinase